MIAASPVSQRFLPVLELLSRLGFSDDLIHRLAFAAEELANDPAGLREFAAFRETWPVLRSGAAAPSDPIRRALAVADAFPEMVHRHEKRGIPFEVTARTARDLERRMREAGGDHGNWGFDRLEWMRNHLVGDLFEIGRLQYIPGKWREVFDLCDDGKSLRPIAHGGLFCDREGWPVSIPTDEGFRTRRDFEGGMSGHAACAQTGAIARDPQRLGLGSRVALTQGNPVLHVHIPSGSGLTPAACRESLREARRFFSRRFPEVRFGAICCRTWLLDRALERVLPPDSNILAFGKLFSPLAVVDADDRQHMERIFGAGADWKTAQPRTRLQKAARAFLLSGGRFRLTSGFIPWDDPILGEV